MAHNADSAVKYLFRSSCNGILGIFERIVFVKIYI